jgi:hypothetical protein
MARLLKYQMEHAQSKLRSISWKHCGEKPKLDFEIPSSATFAQEYLEGKIKITPAMLRKAFLKWQELEMKDSYNRDSVQSLLRKQFYAKAQKAADKALEKELAAYEKRCAVVRAAESRAIDKLVLGGEEAALAAIEEFRKMTF